MKTLKLYLDFDNTIVNTTKRICEMYNEDFKNHPKFIPAKWYLVNKYDFSDQCPLMNKEALMKYFDEDRFFSRLEYMENALEIIHKLSEFFIINIISLGNANNLSLKETWIYNNLPFIHKFVGCNFKDVSDKRHIDMSTDILIDDCSGNLSTSNAKLKILYGDLFEWNKDWNGFRKWNWYEVYDFLME